MNNLRHLNNLRDLRQANELATHLFSFFADQPAATRARLCRSEAARIRANGHARAAEMLEVTAANDEAA